VAVKLETQLKRAEAKVRKLTEAVIVAGRESAAAEKRFSKLADRLWDAEEDVQDLKDRLDGQVW